MTGALEKQLRDEAMRERLRNAGARELRLLARRFGGRKLEGQMTSGRFRPRAVPVYEAPWLSKTLDRLMRCQACGQLLGKRCARDGCGEQVDPLEGRRAGQRVSLTADQIEGWRGW